MQDLSLHLIGDSVDGKRYFVNLIKPRGQGVARGDVCFLFLSSNKQSPAEQQRNISIAASVLLSFGVEVLPKYRRAVLDTDEHMPISAWLSHGQGETIQLPNGDTFVGVSLNGTPYGQGTLIKPNRDVYLGNFKEGHLDGDVEVYHSSGAVTHASFSQGELGSVTKKVEQDGTIKTGEFSGMMLNGAGKETRPDGTVFTGRYVDGLREGAFTVDMPDGARLHQQWIAGKKVFEAPGKTEIAQLQNEPLCGVASPQWVYFSGACENGKATGQGGAVSANGDAVLVGEFQRGDIASGQVIYRTGNFYQGALKGMQPEGKGISGSSDGSVSYEGTWKQGVKNGRGACVYEGLVEACEYSQGRRVDAVYEARQALARQMKERQREAARLRECQGTIEKLDKKFGRLEKALSYDKCDYPELFSRMETARDEEMRQNAQYNGTGQYLWPRDPLEGVIEEGRHCTREGIENLDDLVDDSEYYGSKLSKLDCLEADDIANMSASFQGSATLIREQLEKYDGIMDEYQDWFDEFHEYAVAMQARQAAQERARGWAETFQYGAETLGSIATDVRAVDREIQQNARRTMKLYTPRRMDSYSVKKHAAQAGTTTPVSSAGGQVVDARTLSAQFAEKCRAEGNTWNPDKNVCQVKTSTRKITIQLPGTACYDPSGQTCQSGETIGTPRTVQVSVLDASGSSQTSTGNATPAPKGAESIPIRVSGKGTEMPTQKQALTNLGSTLNNKANEACTKGHQGRPIPAIVSGARYMNGEFGPFQCNPSKVQKDWWICQGELNKRCKLP